VLFTEVFSLAGDADFTTFTRTVTLADPTSARLRFLSGGPADSFGMLLDNVVLTAGAVTTPVPEPSSLLLLGGGVALMGSLVRRRRRA